MKTLQADEFGEAKTLEANQGRMKAELLGLFFLSAISRSEFLFSNCLERQAERACLVYHRLVERE